MRGAALPARAATSTRSDSLLCGLFFLLIIAGCLAPAHRVPDPAPYAATIRWTGHGIPHVTAQDWGGLGYGYGYASASDQLCLLADEFVTARGERSRYFGPDALATQNSIALGTRNLVSDAYLRLNDENPTLRTRSGDEPRPETQRLLSGFADGYNRYLATTPKDHLPSACRDAPWLKPITRDDVVRRIFRLQVFASGWQFAQAMAAAAPPGAQDVPLASDAETPIRTELPQPGPAGLGSNGYAFGRAATSDGHGMLLGNPHWVWQGPERFHQLHLTIPGKLDVMGATIVGFPLVLIGFTNEFAWTHTVSTGWRFSLYELQLVPGDPMSYVYEGAIRKITSRDVTVPVLQPDGTLGTRTVKFYFSHFGPIIERDFFSSTVDAFTDQRLDPGKTTGQPIGLAWTPTHAYTIRDANAHNGRVVEQFFRFNTAKNATEFKAALHEVLGVPWVNTIMAGRSGDAYYADVSVVPNISNLQILNCNTAIGRVLTTLARLPVLDGSKASCEWIKDPRAPQEGILPAAQMPEETRDDYVINSNDSHWLPNPKAPLDGYPQMVGDERTPRSGRTRMGYLQNDERLAGGAPCDIDPQVPCNRYTLGRLQAQLFADRALVPELVRDPLVQAVCGQPTSPGWDGKIVDLTLACQTLRTWDLRSNATSRGVPLFARFWPSTPQIWRVAFDPADAAHTPRGFDANEPRVRMALANAVTELQAASIPIDAPVADVFYATRNEERIPVHGAPHILGSPSLMQFPFVLGKGYDLGRQHGNSYIQTVTWDGTEVHAEGILALSQSTDPTSPYFADQTRLYAQKTFYRFPFTESEVRAHALQTLSISQGSAR
jgi:acyl-homoserine-lactone acylase